MKPPRGLGNAGRALWRSIVNGLPEDWELDEREAAVLALAAKQADDLARCETIVKRDGAGAKGSTGQPVIHPALVEARQGRLAITRLLGQLSLPDEAATGRSAAGNRGQRAARARWDRIAEQRERRVRGTQAR